MAAAARLLSQQVAALASKSLHRSAQQVCPPRLSRAEDNRSVISSASRAGHVFSKEYVIQKSVISGHFCSFISQYPINGGKTTLLNFFLNHLNVLQ